MNGKDVLASHSPGAVKKESKFSEGRRGIWPSKGLPRRVPRWLRATAVAICFAMVAGVFQALVATTVTPAHADAGADVSVDVLVPARLDGSRSGGEPPLNLTWYLGDGTTLYGSAVTHAYEVEGVYQVTLVVRGANGKYDLDTVDVTVRNEVPSSSAGVDFALEEDQIGTFSGSGSDSANDAPSLSYSWDFGDSSAIAAGKVQYHSFQREGSYPASLTVTDDQGAFGKDFVLVTVTNLPPNAQFDAKPEAYEDEPFAFDASMSSDTISDIATLSYAWDFGDGAKGAGRLVSHVYTNAGAYDVALTVTDDNGAAGSVSRRVTVLNAPPTANAGPDGIIDEGGTYLFDATASTDNASDIPLLSYRWDLDSDGTPETTGSRPTYNYADDASVQVDLTVSDDDGLSTRDDMTLAVRNVAPTSAITSAVQSEITTVNITLRMAGEKWHDATMTLRQNGTERGNVTVFRLPGDPKDQEETIYAVPVHRSAFYEATVTYTPENDPVNGQPWGSSPSWIVLDLEDGTEVKFHHTFNAKHPETWTWTQNLSSIVKVEFTGNVFDPGSDGESTTWDFGDGRTLSTNHPSAATYPVKLIESPVHVYVLPGSYQVTFTSVDDDAGLGTSCVTLMNEEGGMSVGGFSPTISVEGPSDGHEAEELDFSASAGDVFGEDVEVSWDFGDGHEDMAAHHSFEHDGAYLVTATAIDSSGNLNRDSVWTSISNVAPVAMVDTFSDAAEDDVVVFNASASTDSPSDLPLLRYSWDFGDGSKGAGVVATHTYTRAGTYTATLTVKDDNECDDSRTNSIIVTNPAPSVQTKTSYDVDEDAVTTFTATVVDNPSDVPRLLVTWRFGDGSTTTGHAVTHRFETPGPKSATVVASDDDGALSEESFTVNVRDMPPRIGVPSSYDFYGAAKAFSYQASTSGAFSDSFSLTWDFGDGGPTQIGTSAVHSYSSHGSHTLLVTARGSDGGVATSSATVRVQMDTDGDRLLDIEEADFSASPDDWDTDGDGLIDSYEVFLLGYEQCIVLYGETLCRTDPSLSDTDGDKLSDWEETWPGEDGYITSPVLPDTDNDALEDSDEAFIDRDVTFIGQDLAYETRGASNSDPDFFFINKKGWSDGRPKLVNYSLEKATRQYRNFTSRTDVVEGVDPISFHYSIQKDSRFYWINLSVDLLASGFDVEDFTSGDTWLFGHVSKISGVSVALSFMEIGVVGARMSAVKAFLSFSNVLYSETFSSDIISFTANDDDFQRSEFLVTASGKTSPVAADCDMDGLLDGEETAGWIALTINSLDALELFDEAVKNGSAATSLIDAFTVRHVSSSPIALDADYDHLPDPAELRHGTDPAGPDSDSDGEYDGEDPDPTVIDPYGPSIHLVYQMVEIGLIDLKTYHMQFSICDAKGVVSAQALKNFQLLSIYELPRSKKCLTYHTKFTVRIDEVFIGAEFIVAAVDETGSINTITLRQPTLIADVVEPWLAELAKSYVGPYVGGILAGMFCALKDTIIDMLDLVLHFGDVLNSLAKVGSEFGKDPTGTMWKMLIEMLRYLDGEQNSTNPYAVGSSDREAYRFSWFLGYVGGALLLSWAGSRILSGIAKPLKFHKVFRAADALDAATDAGGIVRKAGLWARFRPSTKFLIIAGGFTAAFAVASYIWPEIFQAAFVRFSSAAFPAFVLGSIMTPGGPGGTNPAKRAITVLDGYVNEAIPGPRFFKRTAGLGARESVLESLSMGQKVWRYVRAAGDVDVFDPGMMDRKIHRFISAKPDFHASLLAPDGSILPDVLVLFDGDAASGWAHIRNRHILGTDTSGTGRLTLFPADLSNSEIMNVIEETVAKGRIANRLNPFAITFNFEGRYGIDNMLVAFGSDGRIVSAYPIDGPKVIIVRP